MDCYEHGNENSVYMKDSPPYILPLSTSTDLIIIIIYRCGCVTSTSEMVSHFRHFAGFPRQVISPYQKPLSTQDTTTHKHAEKHPWFQQNSNPLPQQKKGQFSILNKIITRAKRLSASFVQLNGKDFSVRNIYRPPSLYVILIQSLTNMHRRSNNSQNKTTSNVKFWDIT